MARLLREFPGPGNAKPRFGPEAWRHVGADRGVRSGGKGFKKRQKVESLTYGRLRAREAISSPLGSFLGQVDQKGAAFPGSALEGHIPTMGLGDVFDDGQS